MKTLNANSLPSNLMNIMGFCYFDPETERLVEFNSNEEIYLTPYESTVRRYYLVVTSDMYNGSKLRYATLQFTSPSDDVEVRALEGLDTVNDRYNFDDVDINTSLTVFFNNHASGIIPIDVNLKSLTSVNGDFKLSVSIKAQ